MTFQLCYFTLIYLNLVNKNVYTTTHLGERTIDLFCTKLKLQYLKFLTQLMLYPVYEGQRISLVVF